MIMPRASPASAATTQHAVLVDGEASGGRFALIATVLVGGQAPPRHRHLAEDETIVVVAGALRVWRDGTWIAAHAGATVALPRGSEHSFIATTETARALLIFSPAGFEGLYLESAHVPAGPSLEHLVALAARY